MTLRIATLAQCETVRFFPTINTSAEWQRIRNTETGEIKYVVTYVRGNRTETLETPDWARAKRQYMLWREFVLVS